MKDFMPINMSSATFSEIKKNWTDTVQEALEKAQSTGSDTITITQKTVIKLDKMPVTTEKDYREAIVPTFKNNTKYAVSLTGGHESEFGGEYELTKDDGTYGLKCINGQTSMFDVEEDDEDLENEE